MCIGRGSYEISDIKEEETLISQIESASVAIYGPNTSPNFGNPELSIGKPIDTKIKMVRRISSVNGQILDPDSLSSDFTYYEIIFEKNGSISIGNFQDFTNKFASGDSIYLSEAVVGHFHPSGAWIEDYNFNGTYTITSVTPFNMILQTPWIANASWNEIHTSQIDVESQYCLIKKASEVYIGPFFINNSANEELWFNFIAQNGLYADNGSEKLAIPVIISVKIEPIDVN